MRIDVQVEGADFFTVMANRALDLSKPLWDKVVPIHYRIATEEFDREGQWTEDSFVPWAPLKAVQRFTEGSRQRKAPRLGTSRINGRFARRQILNQTGKLRKAVTTHSAPATVEITKDNSLIFRSHIDYERYHQEGVPSRNLPARPFGRFLQRAAQDEAMRELMAYVVEPAGKDEAQKVRGGG